LSKRIIMKKILVLGLLVMLFSCEPQRVCKSCVTIAKYPGVDVQIVEFTACDQYVDKLDGEYAYGINPMTGELIFYRMTTCR